MSLVSADLSQLFPASSLSESAMTLLRATGCDFDLQGRLTWLDPVAAARLLGMQSAPSTLRELNTLTQGGAIQAIGASQPVILSAPSDLEIRADSRLRILVLRKIEARNAIHALPNPANDPGARMLLSALADKRMCLFRQPIVSACDARIVRWECLSRLVHEDGRIAQPFEFIPAAERAGLISALDLDTLELALSALTREVDIKLAVNVSAATIADLGSRRAYNDRLFASGDLAHRLTIEITETIAIQDLDVAARFGHSAKTSGARLALDDFGEGHTSFQSLRALPLDEVKIDGLYVESIDARAQSRAFVIAIDRLARDLGMETVAERVETQAEADILREIGVDGLQGYFYGRPQSTAD
jgi:EAL domain-containing protein (putative c-di-GMP-specific phosphodiesterase class I)